MKTSKTVNQMNTQQGSGYYEFRNKSVVTGLSFKVRKKIYDLFMERFGTAQSIADVGVTSEMGSPEANVLEQLYSFKERITALGIEDGGDLEKKFPGLKFQKIEPGAALPFADNHFDVVYSHAVIEHIVNPEARLFFLKELFRIGKNIFVTTPNKYFWIEPHTMIPFIHFLWPSAFNYILNKGLLGKFYTTQNLKLLSKKELEQLGAKLTPKFEVSGVRLFGKTSNLILIASKNS